MTTESIRPLGSAMGYYDRAQRKGKKKGNVGRREIRGGRKSSNFRRELAPQAGFEPATLRLTEAAPKIDRVRWMMMKVMRLSDLRAASEPGSIVIALRK